MPSALETLVKILKLEREQGCNDTAVIGGLAKFSDHWVQEAHAQARKPEHHLLVDELQQLLQGYAQVESRSDRHKQVQYMMDRIMGRAPAPPEFQAPERAPAAPVKAPPETQPERVEPEKPKPRPAEAKRSNAPADRREDRRKPQEQARQTNRPPQRESKREADGFARDEEFAGPSGSRALQMDVPSQPHLARPPRRPRPQVDANEALDTIRGLRKPVTVVKGVGERMTESFNRLGVNTIDDLLYFLPRRYDDYTRLDTIAQLQPNTVSTIIGTVRKTDVRTVQSRRDFHVVVDDGTGLMEVTFFGQHFLSRIIKPQQQIVLSGETAIFRNRLEMKNPEWEHLDTDNLHTIGIVPVYPLTEGLKARGLRRLMQRTVDYWAERLPDYVPEATLERAELADLGWAIQQIHFPKGQDHLGHARNRLIFDELLLLQLAVLGNRRDWQRVPADSLEVDDAWLDSFLAAVYPYELTGAQQRAIADVRQDVRQTIPMNRLLQGDVGSGKTAVATAALALAVANGHQAAIMAPTSILAEQHYRNIGDALAKMPGERQPVVALLTGALSAADREAVRTNVANGSVDVIIGTHALIQEGVEFHDMALAIIDEQHRFGVEQRGALRGKGKNPHLLVMTATPIPRTLALTLHADLDLTLLDEMPPGRKPVQTRVVEPVARERVFSFVESQIEQGRQAFVVHPLVDESEKIDARSALEAYKELSKVFFRYKVGLLHGRMKPAEKDDVMSAFGRGDYDVLVTTSVAEVGVDVPNASVIVIEGANRFGLAQLHQFRGRVGRGSHVSYCLLIPDNNTIEAHERLQAMEAITDGFQLAEIDWKLRGPGDLLGTRQSGDFGGGRFRALERLAEHMTPALAELAQREARTIYAEDPDLSHDEHRLLAQRVQMVQDARSDVS
ncbi:MAG: ATP-dependent DNA helicase RecG [Anaerolineae bacterium]|nr:ATP-dependent DNA helicase RecG [Anaerolineae bacterium]